MKQWATAIVPTVGKSPWLVPCLEALRRSGGSSLRILLVAQGMEALRASDGTVGLADQTLYLLDSIGFAAANNHALAAAEDSELVITVNDDAIVDAGWYESLLRRLDEDPGLGAVQGVNRRLGDEGRLDGWGIGWNRHWQAVQLGHGEPVASAPTEPVEVFGVSATAAIYRRRALMSVKLPGGEVNPQVFDNRFGCYYEDVDLACRLRAAGYRSMTVPEAGARHAGSTSAETLSLGSWQLVYSNRYLALARLLGNRFRSQLGVVFRRDAADFLGALSRGEVSRAIAVFVGWLRASLLLPRYLHRDGPVLSPSEMKRFLV